MLFFLKKHATHSVLLSAAMILLFATGSCTSSTTIRALQPAAFAVPDHVQTLVTIDRSAPTGKKFGNVLEGIVSGEGIGQDQEGATAAIAGVTDALTRTPRFNVKQSQSRLQGGGEKGILAPLPWKEINNLCKSYGGDALLALEAYDTDTNSSTTARQNKKKDKEGKEIIEVYHDASAQTRVKLGWRLYDLKSKRIIDEFSVGEVGNWDERGNTAEEALNRLPAKQLTVNEVSYAAGQKYGMRVAPTWIQIVREYYTSGSDAMKTASKYAKVGEWRQAATIWNREANSSEEKVAKKAAYNMAVACEVEGKFDSALEWTQKSIRLGNKKAKTYHEQIRERIYAQQETDRQMRGEGQAPPNATPSRRPPTRVKSSN